MLKDEINLMLSSLMNNKKAFKKFYKTGYFSYSKNTPSSDRKLSKEKVRFLLQTTLDKLQETLKEIDSLRDSSDDAMSYQNFVCFDDGIKEF